MNFKRGVFSRFFLFSALICSLNLYAFNIGEIPKSVTIEGENGGIVKDSSSWHSSLIKDKVYVMFYVDPDEKDTNSHFVQALKDKKYDRDKYGSIAMINLAATWKPNFVIEALLAKKQEEFPHTIYVKDKKSVLVNEWKLADNASNILLFSKNSELLFYKSGKMSDSDMLKIFKLIEDNL